MNKRLTFHLIGNVVRLSGVLMLLPLIVSLIYGGGDTRALVYHGGRLVYSLFVRFFAFRYGKASRRFHECARREERDPEGDDPSRFLHLYGRLCRGDHDTVVLKLS